MNDNHTFSLFYPLNNGSAGEFITSSSNILIIASAHILLPQLKALHYIIDKAKACYLLPLLKYQTGSTYDYSNNPTDSSKHRHSWYASRLSSPLPVVPTVVVWFSC